MRCHYEVLGVAQNASDSDLKKAYYKMALQWHPDKNPDRMEEAKTQFQLIQAAYDTLSDPQERAFYDRNRDSILRGKASEGGSKPETLDLFKYFSSQCYSGFNDSEKGFYTVYRQVFEKLAVLDMQYMDDEEEEIFIPSFGQSDTDLEDVGRFYAYWSSYCSAMDFRWADEYDIREAQRMGRWVEKKIEKDNNKARQKARRQFNEEVRALVAYVRKRDKRWLERKKQINAKIAENAQKQLACQQRQREERQKSMKEDVEQERANLAAYEEQLKQLEGQFAREWGLTDSEESSHSEEGEAQEETEGAAENPEIGEEELLLDDLYCVACNKSFKTEKAMENHQRSKKHKENLEALKAAMNAEDRAFFNSSTFDNEAEQQNEESATPAQKSSKKKKKKKKSSQESPSVLPTTESVGRKKKNRRKDLSNPVFNGFSSEESDEETEGKVVDVNKGLDANDTTLETDNNVSSNALNCDRCSDSEEVLNEHSNSVKSTSCAKEDQEKKEDKSDDEETQEVKPKLKGKKAKDARKRAKEASGAAEVKETSQCTVCGGVFPSKNKLFQHIKKEGHAALKTMGKEAKGAGKETRRKVKGN